MVKTTSLTLELGAETVTWVAAPWVKVNDWVTLVRPDDEKVRVFEPIKAVLPTPLNVATPATALTVVVPVSAPESMATATATVELATLLPAESRTSITG